MAVKSFADFLHMGGYAAFVWSAFSTVAVVLTGNMVHAWVSFRKQLKCLTLARLVEEHESAS